MNEKSWAAVVFWVELHTLCHQLDQPITMLGRDQGDSIHQVRRGTERRSPLIDLRGLESIGTLEDCP